MPQFGEFRSGFDSPRVIGFDLIDKYLPTVPLKMPNGYLARHRIQSECIQVIPLSPADRLTGPSRKSGGWNPRNREAGTEFLNLAADPLQDGIVIRCPQGLAHPTADGPELIGPHPARGKCRRTDTNS